MVSCALRAMAGHVSHTNHQRRLRRNFFRLARENLVQDFVHDSCRKPGIRAPGNWFLAQYLKICKNVAHPALPHGKDDSVSRFQVAKAPLSRSAGGAGARPADEKVWSHATVCLERHLS